MKPSLLHRGMNFWPPFLFAGIRVREISDDWRLARVQLKHSRFNSNYVGTHFGGSLFAMTDPFWMLLLMNLLGRDYYVWDRRGEIEFVKPGRGTVRAEFRVDDTVLDEIRSATAAGGKYLHWFENEILDEEGEVVARVRKQIYVRRKPDQRPDADESAAG